MYYIYPQTTTGKISEMESAQIELFPNTDNGKTTNKMSEITVVLMH
jgi:hypothetical protein